MSDGAMVEGVGVSSRHEKEPVPQPLLALLFLLYTWLLPAESFLGNVSTVGQIPLPLEEGQSSVKDDRINECH
jgi:hypothetical protein